MSQMDFNAANAPKDNSSFEPLPAGDYNMHVIDSEVKPTKKGNGQQLVLTLEVLDGPYARRRIWDRLNIQNPNADAQRIAERALADLCIAINVMHLSDSNMLHYKPFIGHLTIRPGNDRYGPQNAVRYKARMARPAGMPSAQAQTQSQPEPQPTEPRPPATKPWLVKRAN